MMDSCQSLVWSRSPASNRLRRYGGNSLPSEMIALEPRVMLDGAVAMAALNETDSQADAGGTADADAQATEAAAQNTGSESGNGIAALGGAAHVSQSDADGQAATVVIVDAALKDAAALLIGIDPSAQVFYLNADSDGVRQITDILSGIPNVGELHIFSHGSTGSVTLGATTLDASVVESYASQFVEWDLALAEGADILLYGCNVAADDGGRAFIDLFADLTNADVAASDDLTASTALGGDWQLEVATGAIAASSPLDAASAEAYGYKLGTTLTAGDVAVIQFGTSTETWSVILLSDLASGSTFFVTDHGWNENTDSLSVAEAFGSDGTDRVVLTGDLTAGTVVSSTGGTGYTVTSDIDSVSSSSMNLNAFGDSLIVYETDTNAFDGAVSLLYAFNNANSTTPTIVADETNLGWAATSETPGGGASPQAISHFANGELTNVNVSGADGTSFGLLGLNGEPDSTRVDFGATVNLSPTALRQFVHTVSNWTSTNGESTDFSGTAFTIGAGPAAPAGLDLADGSDTGTSSTDNITSDTTATITGTSVANATISLTSSVDGVVGSTTADGSGNWSITTSALSSGAHDLTATAASGGPESAASTALSITVDTTAPSAPSTPDLAAGSDLGSSSTDNLTNDTTPTFSGTAEVGATVTVISSLAGTLGTVTADGSGDWTFTSGALAEGTHTITATATDTAGNVSAASSGLAITIDTTAPATPGTLDLAAAADTGSASNDNITSDTTPRFFGSTVADSVVTISSSISGVLGTATSNGAGSYLFDSGAVAEGVHTFTATVVDAAGNISDASTGLVVTIDTSAPAAPSAPDLAAGSDLGSSSTDNITSDTTPTWSGTAEANATVELFSGVTSLGTTTADGSGNWSFTSAALADAVHSITATSTDTAGNVSAASAALSVTIETSAPSAPSTPDLAAGSDLGSSSTDNLTSDATPTFSGTAEVGATVTVISSLAGTLGTVTADGSGNWIFTSGALAEGTHTITATATDTAGNVSAASSGLAVTIDTSAPAAPSAPDLAAGSDLGSSSTDNLTSDNTPTWTGTGEANATVELLSGVTSLGTTTADGSGNWSFTSPALADTVHSITAMATDTAGNVSAASAALSVTIDTSAPSAPSTPDLAAASDLGSSSTDNITSDNTPTWTGTSEANATVELFSGVTSLGTTTADGSGNWSLTSAALANNTHSVTARATDAAGNVGAASSALATTIDTNAPSAPGAPDLAAGSDTGSSSTDNVTSDTTPTLTGTAVANSTVTVISSLDGALGTTTADGSGNWSFTSGVLSAGAHTVTATATDTAGNPSGASSGLVVTIDASAPAAPGAPDLAEGSDTGSSSTDNITNDNTPTLTGTSEANATVELFSGVTSLGATTTDGSGNWSFTSPALADTVYSITATSTDTAGNVSAASAALAITIDTSAPSAPGTPDLADASDTGSSNTDNLTGDATPTLTGTAVANSTITVISSLDGTLGTTTADGSGNWSFTSGTLSNGVHNLTATAADTAGNVSAASSALAVTINATPPAAPSAPDLAAASDSGSSSTDNVTSDTTPTLSGTAAANAIVTVISSRDGTLGTTNADGAGTWSFTSGALSDGVHAITATATDAFGNVSGGSAALSLTVVTVAPAVPGAPDLTAASDTGTSSSDNITSNDTPTLTGTAPANARVALTSSLAGSLAGIVGTATADAAGNWSITTTSLALGIHSLSAVATDAAGNSSAASAILLVTIEAATQSGTTTQSGTATQDTVTPSPQTTFGSRTPTVTYPAADAPDIGDPSGEQDTGFGLPGFGRTGNGAGDAGFTPLGDPAGSDAYGSHDGGGNTLSFGEGSDTGTPGGAIVTSEASPVLTGIARPGDSVVISSDVNGIVGTAVADANGNWSVRVARLDEGLHRLTAAPFDADGQPDGAESLIIATIDTIAPPPPPAPTLANGGEAISIRDIAVISGRAEPGTRITLVSDKDGIIAEVLADENGNWQVDAEGLSQNVHTLQVTATDEAGNSSVASAGLQLVVRPEGDSALLDGEDGPDAVEAASADPESTGSNHLAGYLQGFLSGSGGSNNVAAGFTRQLQNARA